MEFQIRYKYIIVYFIIMNLLEFIKKYCIIPRYNFFNYPEVIFVFLPRFKKYSTSNGEFKFRDDKYHNEISGKLRSSEISFVCEYNIELWTSSFLMKVFHEGICKRLMLAFYFTEDDFYLDFLVSEIEEMPNILNYDKDWTNEKVWSKELFRVDMASIDKFDLKLYNFNIVRKYEENPRESDFDEPAKITTEHISKIEVLSDPNIEFDNVQEYILGELWEKQKIWKTIALSKSSKILLKSGKYKIIKKD